MQPRLAAATRRAASRGSAAAPARVRPADAGTALLATCVGWWDAAYWNGGALANLGTDGSAGDFATAGGGKPTYSVDHFAFAGAVALSNAASVSDFNSPTKNTNFTVGLIVRETTPFTGLNLCRKRTGSNQGWQIQSNGVGTYDAQTGMFDASGTHNVSSGGSTASSSGVLTLFTGGCTAAGQVFARRNLDTAAAATDTRTSPSVDASAFTIGTNGTPKTFDLYGAFIHRGAFTDPQLTDICNTYGVPLP